MKKTKGYGIIMIMLAAVLWSSNAPFVRALSHDGVTVLAFRSIIAGVVLLPFLSPKKIKINRYFFGYIVCFLGVVFGVTLALKTTSSAIAVGMQYTSCIWLFLIAKPKKKDWKLSRIWPMLLLIVGVVITMFSGSKGISMVGNLIALSTSFTFAGLTWFAKKINTENPVGLSCIGNLIAGIVALIISRPSLSFISKVSINEWLIYLYLGVFQVGVAYSLYYMGLKQVSSATATMIAPLEMILAPTWTAIFLGELPNLVGLIGFIIVVIGVLGEAFVSSRHSHAGNIKEKKDGKKSEGC